MATKIPIGGELDPKTVERVLADAETVMDRTQGKRQSEINAEQKETNSEHEGTMEAHASEIEELKKEDIRLAQDDADLKELLDAKVIEAGGVPFDYKPTKDSTNAITSGAVYSYTVDSDLLDGIESIDEEDIPRIYQGPKGDPFKFEDFTEEQLGGIVEGVEQTVMADKVISTVVDEKEYEEYFTE